MGLSWIIVLGLIAIIGFNLWFGYKKGMVYELALLISLILTILLMKNIIFPLAKNFDHMLLFIVLSFVIILLVIKFLLKKIKFINKVAVIGFMNKLLGMIIGMIKSFIIVTLLMLIIYSPLVDNGKTMIQTNPVLNQLDMHLKSKVPFYNQTEKIIDVTNLIRLKGVM